MSDNLITCKLLPGFTHRKGRAKGGPVLMQPGDTEDLTLAQLEAFKDRFIPIETAKAEEKIEELKAQQTENKLKVVHKGAGKYDVIDTETGEAINDETLTKAQADALIS